MKTGLIPIHHDTKLIFMLDAGQTFTLASRGWTSVKRNAFAARVFELMTESTTNNRTRLLWNLFFFSFFFFFQNAHSFVLSRWTLRSIGWRWILRRRWWWCEEERWEIEKSLAETKKSLDRIYERCGIDGIVRWLEFMVGGEVVVKYWTESEYRNTWKMWKVCNCCLCI